MGINEAPPGYFQDSVLRKAVLPCFLTVHNSHSASFFTMQILRCCLHTVININKYHFSAAEREAYQKSIHCQNVTNNSFITRHFMMKRNTRQGTGNQPVR